jgi:O-acetyl-ADP-ribose deacetylase (regulator of RNase III)
MILETTGDILTADVEALVNPVNTVGVMGAGLACQVKHTFPDVFRAYAAACQRDELRTGIVIAHPTGTNPRYVVSFPTKQHWRDPSKLEWIEQGLIGLRETIDDLGIRSIAIPPLGCGLGGLDWPDVRGLIVERLGDLDVDVVLYGPKGEM